MSSKVMLVQIIRELTKAKESAYITGEQISVWAKRVEAQRVQSAIMDSLTRTKEFIMVMFEKGGLIYNGRNVQTHAKVSAKKSCSYCGSSLPPRQCLSYGKKCADCSKINHFREFCRSRRKATVHYIEQEPDQHKEKDHIETVNINMIISNSKWSAITANLKLP